MSGTLLNILQHALGRDQYGQRKRGLDEDYRNHYVEGEGSTTIVVCRYAVARGLMTEYQASPVTGGDPWFRVTAAGKAYITEHSPKPPRLTRGQQRYQQWLDESDCTDETFGEWLRRKTRERHEVAA